MRTRGKVALVVTGYVVALLVAAGVVAVYVALTDSPDRQASSGMCAFGDGLLFLAVFGVVGAVPTGVALFFLRSWRRCWPALAVAALITAIPGALALGFGLATVFAPSRSPRLALLAATLAEAGVFGGWVAALGLRWLQTR